MAIQSIGMKIGKRHYHSDLLFESVIFHLVGTSINTTPATFGKTEARVGDEVTRGCEGAIL